MTHDNYTTPPNGYLQHYQLSLTGSQTLTYQALNQAANQVAHALLKYHIGLHDHIGLALEPSMNLIIYMLAIIKLGAAYVPIDPLAAPERNQAIVKNAQLKYLITDEAFESLFEKHVSILTQITPLNNINNIDLNRQDMHSVMQAIMQGNATPAQIGGLLVADDHVRQRNPGKS